MPNILEGGIFVTKGMQQWLKDNGKAAWLDELADARDAYRASQNGYYTKFSTDKLDRLASQAQRRLVAIQQARAAKG